MEVLDGLFSITLGYFIENICPDFPRYYQEQGHSLVSRVTFLKMNQHSSLAIEMSFSRGI